MTIVSVLLILSCGECRVAKRSALVLMIVLVMFTWRNTAINNDRTTFNTAPQKENYDETGPHFAGWALTYS